MAPPTTSGREVDTPRLSCPFDVDRRRSSSSLRNVLLPIVGSLQLAPLAHAWIYTTSPPMGSSFCWLHQATPGGAMPLPTFLTHPQSPPSSTIGAGHPSGRLPLASLYDTFGQIKEISNSPCHGLHTHSRHTPQRVYHWTRAIRMVGLDCSRPLGSSLGLVLIGHVWVPSCPHDSVLCCGGA